MLPSEPGLMRDAMESIVYLRTGLTLLLAPALPLALDAVTAVCREPVDELPVPNDVRAVTPGGRRFFTTDLRLGLSCAEDVGASVTTGVCNPSLLLGVNGIPLALLLLTPMSLYCDCASSRSEFKLSARPR